MSEKKSVTVTIYGNEYTLKGEADPQYILELAKFVDGKMTEIGKKSSAPAAKVAILASMNIADELHRLEKSKSENVKLIETLEKSLLEMKKSSDGSLKHTMELKEHLEKARAELSELRSTAENLKKDKEKFQENQAETIKKVEELEQEAKRYKRELESLKPTLESLQADLKEETQKNESVQDEIKETLGQLEKTKAELNHAKENHPATKISTAIPEQSLPVEKLASLFKKIDAILE
jgi:cell division protein ZapA